MCYTTNYLERMKFGQGGQYYIPVDALSWHQAQIFQMMGSFFAQAVCNTDMGYETSIRCMGKIFYESYVISPYSWTSHFTWQQTCLQI